jgi:phage tail sheath protein FI
MLSIFFLVFKSKLYYMPVQPTYPGVYIQEVPSDVRTITGVSTSVALFIGLARWGPVNKPVLCFNYSDFERSFTSDTSLGDLPRAVKLFFLNGGSQCYVIRIAFTLTGGNPLENYASASLVSGSMTITAKHPGVTGNSIRFVISDSDAATQTFHLKAFRDVGSAELDVQEWDKVSLDTGEARFLERFVNYKWAEFKLTDPAITTLPADTAVPAELTGGQEGIAPTDVEYELAYESASKNIDLFNLLVLPQNIDISATPAAPIIRDGLWSDASSYCEKRRAFLIMDPKNNWDDDESVIGADLPGLRAGLVNQNSAIYFPNVTIQEGDGELIPVGPSGAIAGLMARTDTNRGVWKAPAGTEAGLRGIRGLQYRLTDEENGFLNPQGLNVLRAFPNGLVSWGARTMDGDDDFASEWKYIPVRRTALFIEESLYRGLKWVVFEPNDEKLWGQIRLNVGAFMHNLFRQGAFQGTKKSDAYFVKCDAETTPQNDINLGIVNVWVGFAPLKPAEFVILHLQQMTGQVQI